MSEENKTKKVVVNWCEMHYYEAEIEVPGTITEEEELDWVMNNTDDWEKGWREPYEICTDWDSFEVVYVME